MEGSFMNQRLLALFFLGVPAACRATEARPAPLPDVAPTEMYVHRALVKGVPAEAESVRLTVSVPARCPAGELCDLRAAVLVGNASVELPLRPGFADALESPSLSLSWSETGELVLETQGKPVELDLCFALASSDPGSVAALERELSSQTRAEIDEQRWDGVRTRFERLR